MSLYTGAWDTASRPKPPKRSTYQADVRALLEVLASGNRPTDIDRVAQDLLSRSAGTPKAVTGPIDTSELTDAQLFAHYKRTAIAGDLSFFLRLTSLSPELRARAQSLTNPTAKDIAVLRTLWRTERQTSDAEQGIPSIGSVRWAEYYQILKDASEDIQAVADAESEGLAS